jgi:hypothetical protein
MLNDTECNKIQYAFNIYTLLSFFRKLRPKLIKMKSTPGVDALMLWSQFSAIFANFSPIGVVLKNVLMEFFTLLSFVSSQKRQFFRHFFGAKIFKKS